MLFIGRLLLAFNLTFILISASIFLCNKQLTQSISFSLPNSKRGFCCKHNSTN